MALNTSYFDDVLYHGYSIQGTVPNQVTFGTNERAQPFVRTGFRPQSSDAWSTPIATSFQPYNDLRLRFSGGAVVTPAWTTPGYPKIDFARSPTFDLPTDRNRTQATDGTALTHGNLERVRIGRGGSKDVDDDDDSESGPPSRIRRIIEEHAKKLTRRRSLKSEMDAEVDYDSGSDILENSLGSGRKDVKKESGRSMPELESFDKEGVKKISKGETAKQLEQLMQVWEHGNEDQWDEAMAQFAPKFGQANIVELAKLRKRVQLIHELNQQSVEDDLAHIDAGLELELVKTELNKLKEDLLAKDEIVEEYKQGMVNATNHIRIYTERAQKAEAELARAEQELAQAKADKNNGNQAEAIAKSQAELERVQKQYNEHLQYVTQLMEQNQKQMEELKGVAGQVPELQQEIGQLREALKFAEKFLINSKAKKRSTRDERIHPGIASIEEKLQSYAEESRTIRENALKKGTVHGIPTKFSREGEFFSPVKSRKDGEKEHNYAGGPRVHDSRMNRYPSPITSPTSPEASLEDLKRQFGVTMVENARALEAEIRRARRNYELEILSTDKPDLKKKRLQVTQDVWERLENEYAHKFSHIPRRQRRIELSERLPENMKTPEEIDLDQVNADIEEAEKQASRSRSGGRFNLDRDGPEVVSESFKVPSQTRIAFPGLHDVAATEDKPVFQQFPAAFDLQDPAFPKEASQNRIIPPAAEESTPPEQDVEEENKEEVYETQVNDELARHAEKPRHSKFRVATLKDNSTRLQVKNILRNPNLSEAQKVKNILQIMRLKGVYIGDQGIGNRKAWLKGWEDRLTTKKK